MLSLRPGMTIGNLLRRLLRLAQIGPIGELDPLLEGRTRLPAEPRKPPDVEQLLRRTGGTRRIIADRAGVTDHAGDDVSEVGDGDVLASADIDEFIARI